MPRAKAAEWSKAKAAVRRWQASLLRIPPFNYILEFFVKFCGYKSCEDRLYVRQLDWPTEFRSRFNISAASSGKKAPARQLDWPSLDRDSASLLHLLEKEHQLGSWTGRV